MDIQMVYSRTSFGGPYALLLDLIAILLVYFHRFGYRLEICQRIRFNLMYFECIPRKDTHSD